jgi:hypothetical protein
MDCDNTEGLGERVRGIFTVCAIRIFGIDLEPLEPPVAVVDEVLEDGHGVGMLDEFGGGEHLGAACKNCNIKKSYENAK